MQEPEVQGHPRLRNEFEDNLGYLRPCLKTKQTNRDGGPVWRVLTSSEESLMACLLELKVAWSLVSHLPVPWSTYEVLT